MNLSVNIWLQGLLEGVSLAFTKNFHFIDSVKTHLSYTLLRACVSSSPVIFQVHLCAFFSPLIVLFEYFMSDNKLGVIVCFGSTQLEFLQYYCYVLERVLRYYATITIATITDTDCNV